MIISNELQIFLTFEARPEPVSIKACIYQGHFELVVLNCPKAALKSQAIAAVVMSSCGRVECVNLNIHALTDVNIFGSF